MLTKILVNLSAWFVLSVMVGLLAGRAISTFREAPVPGVAPPLETDWEAAALRKLEEKEMPIFTHARMEEVRTPYTAWYSESASKSYAAFAKSFTSFIQNVPWLRSLHCR